MNNNKDIYDQDIRKELENLSEKLSGLNKNNPFSTPKDYFDELPLIIKENCIANDKKPFFKIFFENFILPKYAIGFALLFIAILSVSIIFLNQENNSSTSEFAEITWEDVLKSDPHFFDDYSESELITTLISQRDEDMNLLTPSFEENISDEDLIDYLSNEDYEIEILYDL